MLAQASHRSLRSNWSSRAERHNRKADSLVSLQHAPIAGRADDGFMKIPSCPMQGLDTVGVPASAIGGKLFAESGKFWRHAALRNEAGCHTLQRHPDLINLADFVNSRPPEECTARRHNIQQAIASKCLDSFPHR